MSWVKVDDKIAFHRKVVAAGNEAFGAWMRMTTWSADQLADGIIPASIAWVIVGIGRDEVIQTLLRVGLLERSRNEAGNEADDFVVHDYHDHNPLAADVKAARNQASEAKRRAGAAGGRVSGRVRSSKREAETKQNGSNGPSKKEAKRSPNPNPNPNPNPLEKEKSAQPPTDLFTVIDAWQTGWVARFMPEDGKPPEATPVDWKLGKALLAAHGLAGSLALVSRFLADPDPFVAKLGHRFRDLPGRVDAYRKGIGQMSMPTVGHARPAPHNTETTEYDL